MEIGDAPPGQGYNLLKRLQIKRDVLLDPKPRFKIRKLPQVFEKLIPGELDIVAYS